MSPVVFILSKIQLDQLRNDCSEYLINPPAYTIFQAKLPNLVITAYKSGKVVFQGKQAQDFINEHPYLSTTKPVESKSKKNNTIASSNLPVDFKNWSIIGADENGTGSYFGPVIVCAAYVNKNLLSSLKQMGVKDSKKMSDVHIIRIADQLKQMIPYQLLVCSPKKYNEVHKQYNMNEIKAQLFNHALLKLTNILAPKKPEAYLVDQFCESTLYYSYLKHQKECVKDGVFFATKGESHHLAVAAASIIARATFLEELNKLSQSIGITLPSGSSRQSDEVAALIIKEKGVKCLETVAKMHFKNTEKAMEIIQN